MNETKRRILVGCMSVMLLVLLVCTALPAAADAAPRLSVMDFGAKADGVHDDSPAFRQAVEAAIAAGKGAVLFVPAGRYSLRTPMGGSMIEIANATDLTLQGEKGTLLIASDPTKHVVQLLNCTRVAVRGLEMDRHPLVFTQGRVAALDAAAKTVDVTIDPGYDEPDAKYLARLKSFLVFTDPASDTWDHRRWWPAIVIREKLAPRKWRFTLNPAPLPDYAGKRWLLWDNTYKGWGVVVNRSQDCCVEDVAYYGGGADAGIGVWSSAGTITYRRFKVGVPPGSDRLIAAAGGGQEFQNRGTLIMDACDISRVDDDGCNMGTTYAQVLRQIDPRTIVVKESGVPFRVGDSLALWDWFLKKERSQAKLVQVARDDATSVRLTLDADLQVLHPCGSPGLPRRSDWKGGGRFEQFDGIDRVADFEAAGKMIIKNCRFQNMRARCILVKTSDSVIENNTFYNTHMTAILAGPEFYWGEAPAVRNLVIRNNRFINIDGSSINLGCHESANSFDNRNILIEGNSFENYGAKGGVGISGKQGTAVLIRNADGVMIRNNKFGPPASTAPKDAQPLLVEASRNVIVKDNEGISNDGQIGNRPLPESRTARPLVLKAQAFRHYVEDFNRGDNEIYQGNFPNAAAWDFLKDNIPLLDCPDEEIQRTYYFRWWTYRKHIKKTPAGFVVDEFLPNVGWAGKCNSINCAAGHHIYEGRWLRDRKYIDDYTAFWFGKGGNPRSYSFWAADSVWARYCVTGDRGEALRLLPDLIANYAEWEKAHRDASGLYWQIDDRDGMEVSIGGNGYRATINSYQFGDALAIARIAELAGKADVARNFREKAAAIKKLVQEKLWDADARFFKVLPRGENRSLVDVRELHGFTPWYVNLPDPQFSVAWKQVMDPQGFFAPFGLTTAEQRHPKFALAYAGHECQWNGPSWPFSTAVTLTGLANVLNGPAQDAVSAKDYFQLLKIYAKSQRRKLDDGRVVPWIDENQNPTNGDWISRTLLIQRKQQPQERGKDYNHSTFCDLVISGLVGLRPRGDDTLEVHPLVPPSWDYFCLDQIPYHGCNLTILFDKTGSHYGKGKGLRVFADGENICASETLTRLSGPLPVLSVPCASSAESPPPAAGETSGGWQKFAGNPVMGGKYGTCFDISVLRVNDTYRMWLSWRPKRSVALVESKDGIHWSEPPQIVLGPRKETGWEDNINRPYVLKRGDGYHMWYTGQVKPGARDGHSWIGYATSPDGVTWKRMSAKPVLACDQTWEKGIAVMCPSVIWDEPARLFRMWYSGGEQNEPNAIGYATSPDGLTWKKYAKNPVFGPEAKNSWEKHKVAGVQVERRGDWYVMFYIGYQEEPNARICLARSKDGITNWQRHSANPIIVPGKDQWDHDACYKPFAIFDGKKWLLWYNGRHGNLEQIGVAIHEGEDLGFGR